MGKPRCDEERRVLIDNLLKVIKTDVRLVCAGIEPDITKESVDLVLNTDIVHE